MISERWTSETIKELDLSGNRVEKPVRFVDIDVTSSFAHLTPNITIDEVLGYRRASTLELATEEKAIIILMDYDGIIPSREKPSADTLETIFRTNDKSNSPQVLLRDDIPISLQTFDKEIILREIDKDWKSIIKNTISGKKERIIFANRFIALVEAMELSAATSSSASEFLQDLRRRFLSMLEINAYPIPESTALSLFTQKLQEDLEAGFPYWKMQVPEKFEAKHKSNQGTYLVYGICKKGELANVSFYENPGRFEFNRREDERVVILAEDSIQAIVKRELMPTTTLLNYIVLSPARKKRDNERTKRVHIAGNFMAGRNGYALELLPFFNAIPGYDEVSLVCTGYDGRCTIKGKQRNWIGFGTVFPHFGKKGLEKYLEQEAPFSLDKGIVLGEEI
ncbi:hypothetical protein HY500_04230 [Candidatus Woesearchaeota archaeon]|nr:hypothetical protein [Candidatus Woesearchaeota archaeon]